MSREYPREEKTSDSICPPSILNNDPVQVPASLHRSDKISVPDEPSQRLPHLAGRKFQKPSRAVDVHGQRSSGKQVDGRPGIDLDVSRIFLPYEDVSPVFEDGFSKILLGDLLLKADPDSFSHENGVSVGP